jgi:hypothetical protein
VDKVHPKEPQARLDTPLVHVRKALAPPADNTAHPVTDVPASALAALPAVVLQAVALVVGSDDKKTRLRACFFLIPPLFIPVTSFANDVTSDVTCEGRNLSSRELLTRT